MEISHVLMLISHVCLVTYFNEISLHVGVRELPKSCSKESVSKQKIRLMVPVSLVL